MLLVSLLSLFLSFFLLTRPLPCPLSSLFSPQYEILLCVQDQDDPAIDVCKKLLGKYPNVDARLFIGKLLTTFRSPNSGCIIIWCVCERVLV